MASRRVEIMSSLSIVFFLCAFGGVCYGENKACSMNQVDIMSKVVTCVTEKHPEDLILVLTRMNNLASMESSEFMCRNPELVTTGFECMLQYLKGCMPAAEASQVMKVMPTRQTVQKGVEFLCAHRNDFDNPCVKKQLMPLVQCVSSKMQSYASVLNSAAVSPTMHDVLCRALEKDEQCLDSTLTSCPREVSANFKQFLRTIFPTKNCPRTPQRPQVLLFQPGRPH